MKTIELPDNPVLEDVEKAIDRLWTWTLFEYTNSDNMPAIAEQHFLLGISSLETAMRHIALA